MSSARLDGLRVCLVARGEPGTTGTSRYVEALATGLEQRGARLTLLGTAPSGPLAGLDRLGARLGLDARTFLTAYPPRLRWPAADLYHLTVGTYASALLACRPPGPVVVTVHDIIPYLSRHDARFRSYSHAAHRLADSLAMRGLRRADLLLADSAWTASSLARALRIPGARLRVAPLGVDLERFQPRAVRPDEAVRLELRPGAWLLLYVGSADPRKNLGTLIEAFARVRARELGGALVLAGRPHHLDEQRRLQALADRLGLADAVRWLERVDDADLASLYNLARVAVLPSLAEGFGLPVLEALASGRPVVCANRASLPEVAGADAILCEPSVEGLAAALERALTLPDDAPARQARRAWASGFDWERAIDAVVDGYEAVLGKPQ